MVRSTRPRSLAHKERAYIAASRRSDRSMEARLDSGRAASGVHHQRTGRSLYITREIIERDEMYDEVDDLAWHHLHRHGKITPSIQDALPPKRNNYIQDNEDAHDSTRESTRQAAATEGQYNMINRLFDRYFHPQDYYLPLAKSHQQYPKGSQQAWDDLPDPGHFLFSQSAAATVPAEDPEQVDLAAFVHPLDTISVLTDLSDPSSPPPPPALPSLCWDAPSPSSSWGLVSPPLVTPPTPPPQQKQQQQACLAGETCDDSHYNYHGGDGGGSKAIVTLPQTVDPSALSLQHQRGADAENLRGFSDDRSAAAMVDVGPGPGLGLEPGGKIPTMAAITGGFFGSPAEAAAMAAAVGPEWDELWGTRGRREKEQKRKKRW